MSNVIKRDKSVVPYDNHKVEKAIAAAFIASEEVAVPEISTFATVLANSVRHTLRDRYHSNVFTVSVEEIQDTVETLLMFNKFSKTAKAYILYRSERSNIRNSDSALMKALDTIVNTKSTANDEKRSNANIDGDTSMGAMLQIGATASKEYYLSHLISKEHADAHRQGYIHIHDLDFYGLTTTCTQIDFKVLAKNGFSTGHGYLREPNSIGSYAALAAIAIQSNQNDQHGGQSIPNFDYAMAEGVRKTFKKSLCKHLFEILEDFWYKASEEDIQQFLDVNIVTVEGFTNPSQLYRFSDELCTFVHSDNLERCRRISQIAVDRAIRDTDRQTYQAMEGFIHNLNTMHSRAGAQTPFSSINYGTDTSPEGRMAIKNILLAEEAGLGNGETPIFPIHIFKVKEGVNYFETDPNFDLFKLSWKVSAKRLFPNYVFLDSPFNLQYYQEGHPETEVATMGCRTRVIGNRCGPEITYGRGNLSFTSINLPRLAIESKGDESIFYKKLNKMLNLVKDQLLDRFEIQAKRHVYNYPFLMGQGVWLDSDKLRYDDYVREVIKHGTLSIGFIGLAETLTALYGQHHGESDEMQKKGLDIISYMRKFCDDAGEETGLNFSLLATPAEGLSGRFTKMDKEKFGTIKGVTDREYYTNSFHVPVWYSISIADKIEKEAPYHALTNAGHITYVEVDGDISNNLDAFETIVRCMHDAHIGYGSINHPVDRDPVCGYVGVIGETCPRCGRKTGEAISLDKLDELRKKYSSVPVYRCNCN